MSKQRTEIIKLLIYGMIGAVVTMIGDCLLLAGFFGFIGIPVTAFVFKVLINGIGKLGTGAFLNGLACSNMSLGALIIFIGWMIVVLKTRDERRV